MAILTNTISSVAFTNYITDGTDTLPVALADVKEHLKIAGTDEDTYITNLITVATELAEKITGRDFINKTYEAYLDYFPCNGVKLEIRKSKLQSITSIEYYKDGVLTTFASESYDTTNSNLYSQVFLNNNYSYPTADTRPQAVKITFVAGYGASADDVPQGIKQGLYMLIAGLYENRGDCDDCVRQLANNVLQAYKLPSLILRAV
jgi:uncharacterized phiE125 gp8 family phage protein